MKKITSLTFVLFVFLSHLIAQNITIQPYLQDVEPHAAFILWETDGNEESIVEWGLTTGLGNEVSGIAYPSNGGALIHEVQLQDLERFTKYYYRVKTGTAVSEIFHFKTPPFAGDQNNFRIVALSDMQKDNSQPDKFREIVEDGVIDYLENLYGEDLTDHLALVMIPGDLVVDGNNFNQWRNDFFTPSEKLWRHVPVYPVLGNHENNASFYFTYFKLPENGTPGYEEHWWYKDYGNLRIIGLNSNGPFNNADQLTWLDNLLDETCAADSIDFVFAQLHHPHKSELWTPGESGFTGEVITRIEQFTTDCEKPSIHFFGHTHGYSRGQSRDHKHLWINVATAGGAIDNWGEFPNFDYEEFSVSQDEYGFVVVEVEDGNDPKLTIKRISRGDQDQIINNQLTDSLVVSKSFVDVSVPSPIYPVEVEVVPECVTLQADAFDTSGGLSAHGQSHWQVTTFQNGFDNPVAESWKNFENWYFDIDTQAGDDLTDEVVLGLEPYTSYLWRVRYRDKAFNWSEWSDPVSFTTGATTVSPNLLSNPGAESELENWTITQGIVEALTSQVCAGIDPYNGERYFAVGGLCEHSEVGIAVQDIDVSMFVDSIDTGQFAANFGGYLSNYGGDDLPEMRLLFFDDNGGILGESEVLSTLNNSWTYFSAWVDIPVLTRTIQMELKGTRNAGTDNDSYFDDLFVKVGTEVLDCSPIVSLNDPYLSYIAPLKIAPNPIDTYTRVFIPDIRDKENLSLHIVSLDGRKINSNPVKHDNYFELERGNLSAGTYIVWMRNTFRVIGTAKFVIP